MNDKNNDRDYWEIPLGFRLSKELNLIAFVAFTLSIITLFNQIKACSEGAKIVLFPPDQVFIIRDDTFVDGKPRLILGAGMVYVNNGQEGYNGIVRMESVLLTINGKEYTHDWDRFCNFDCVNGKVKYSNETPVAFKNLKAGETISHQTKFTPWPVKCNPDSEDDCNVLDNHVYWDDFINHLKRITEKGPVEYEFKFKASVYNKPDQITSCKIQLNSDTVRTIESLKSYCPTCYPSSN